MAELTQIVSFLDSYLKIDEIDDSSWNGLQFEGGKEVEKIILAVDAGEETFELAVRESAQLIIVHHGHFWKSSDPSIKGWAVKRLEILFNNGISLYACHLPFDRHPEIGNNALLIKLLGAEIDGEFLHIGDKNIGWQGKFKSPKDLNEIVKALGDELNAECVVLPFGKPEVSTVAVCSGGGGYDGFYEALASGADLYLTGDSIEVFHTAKDAGLNVIFAGHHATEIIGIKALAEPLEKNFRVEAVFFDLPTGL